MAKQQEEPPWDRNERVEREKEKGEAEKGEEDAFIGLGKMFPEEEDKIRNPFETSFGAAFRKTREAMKQK